MQDVREKGREGEGGEGRGRRERGREGRGGGGGERERDKRESRAMVTNNMIRMHGWQVYYRFALCIILHEHITSD